MNWIKRGCEISVAEVFRRNTGYSDSDLKELELKDYRIDGLKEAAELVREAVMKKERITVVADYDVDGVMSAFIMDKLLTHLKAAHVIRIPRRFSEGYGLNESIIDEIPSGLLITVDNGISAITAIMKAKDKGLKVIILDHHLPVGLLPNADVIIDPNAGTGAEFTGYCGAALAYRFAKSLTDDENLITLSEICAAFATIADVMPLREENRLIVKKGLKDAVNHSYLLPKGFYTLLSKLQLFEHISEKDVGFKIAPCINASGRLYDDGGSRVLKALSENDPRVIDDIILANEKRKELTKKLTKEAERVIHSESLENSFPMLIYIPDAPLGILGLVASSITEKYKRPSFVVSDCNGILKGSGRSYGNKDIKEMLDKCSYLLKGYGGHAAAAGISLNKEDLPYLREALCSIYGPAEEPGEDIYYDLEINESSFKTVLSELESYGPFGEGNPEIIFRINNYRIYPREGRDYVLMGKDRSVIRFQGISSDAIGFDCLRKYEELGKPERINIIGTLSYNHYHGKKRATIEIIDLDCA